LLARPVTGDELAQEVLTFLSTELGAASTKLLASIRDRASVNGKAMHTIGIMFPVVMTLAAYA